MASVFPDLPGGYASNLWREVAYRSQGKKGYGDVMFQICARAAISEYNFKSPQYGRIYTVKKNEFYSSKRHLCLLTSKNYRTLKTILLGLVQIQSLEFEEFEDCVRLKVLHDPAGLDMGCSPNTTRGVVAEIQQGSWSKYNNLVAEIQQGRSSNTTSKEKGKKRKEKGEEKEKIPPPQSQFSNSPQSGNQDIPPKDEQCPSIDAIRLGDDWYGWLTEILPNPGFNVSDFHRGSAEIIDILKGSVDKARRVFEFIKSDQKMSRLFISPTLHSKKFGDTTYLNDVLIKIRTTKEPETERERLKRLVREINGG